VVHLLILCSILKPVLPTVAEGASSSSYIFLRRFVTTPNLPPSLRNSVQLQVDHAKIHLLIPPPLTLDADDIIATLRPHVQSGFSVVVRTTHIPVDPPTTAEQASLWSQTYWPCNFNPASQTIQKAPPLRVLRTTQAELDEPVRLESYFSLAHLAAAECVDGPFGRKVGAVVVDPVKEEVIAVAGDARWFGQSSDSVNGKSHGHSLLAEGRPEHHALMRAIAMVADKEARRQSPSESSSTNAGDEHITSRVSRALTPLEKFYAASPIPDIPLPHPQTPETEREIKFPPLQSVARPAAYLCHGLDIYLTHEPCIACAMAMIHSRFRVCVFRTRMPKTGGLCAEKESESAETGAGLGYGLFWRRELNWRVLTFQYQGQHQSESQQGENSRGNEAGFNA
jgi:tRNA-specific adenosine deaminase 3